MPPAASVQGLKRRVTCSTSPRHMGPPGTTLDIPGVIRLHGSFSTFTSWKVWRGRGISAVGIESALTTWRPLNKAGAFPYPFRSLSAWQSLDCLHSRQKSWLVSLLIFAARDCFLNETTWAPATSISWGRSPCLFKRGHHVGCPQAPHQFNHQECRRVIRHPFLVDMAQCLGHHISPQDLRYNPESVEF